MVPLLKTKGFQCHAEEAVFSTSQESHAHLLSLVGTREAVKAVWARLMKRESALMVDDVRSVAVRMNPEGGRLLTERLPSGAFHGLLLSRALLGGEVVLGEHEAELPGRFYRLLSAQLRLPLHPAWAGWLWERALATEVATRLESRRLHAFEVKLYRHDLEAAVRQALVAGELPEVRETANAA